MNSDELTKKPLPGGRERAALRPFGQGAQERRIEGSMIEYFGYRDKPLPRLRSGWIGRIPDRFKLSRSPQLIDEGSTCRVYKCYIWGTDQISGRERSLALKALPLGSGPDDLRFILDEITNQAAVIGCENIVQLLDWEVDLENGEAFLLEELCQPLHKYRRAHRLDASDIFYIGMEICSALEQCQARGVAHLDVQPRNIFFREPNHFVLGDFSSALRQSRLSGEKNLRGTLAFMAPEVYLGRKYSIQSDLYSLALVIYCMLNNNRMPFVDESGIEEGIRRRLHREVLPPVNGACDAFNEKLSEALNPEPEERFDNPEAMREWLHKCMKEASYLEEMQRDSPSYRLEALRRYREELAGKSSDDPSGTKASVDFDAPELLKMEHLKTVVFHASETSRDEFDVDPFTSSEQPSNTIAAHSDEPSPQLAHETSSAPDFDADPFTISCAKPDGDQGAPILAAAGPQDEFDDLVPPLPEDEPSPHARRHHFPPTAFSATASPLSLVTAPIEGLAQVGFGLASLGGKLHARRQKKKEAKRSASRATESAPGMEPQPQRVADSTPPADVGQTLRSDDGEPVRPAAAQPVQSAVDQTVPTAASQPAPPAAQPVPSPTANSTPSPADEPVQFSVVAPKRFQRDAYTMLDVFMYEDAARAVVEQALAEGESEMAESRSGRLMAAKGTKVRVVLSSPDLALADCEESGVWAGDHLRFSFAVRLPAEYAKSQILFNASIYFDGVLVTRLKFIASCASDSEQRPEVARQDIRSAFISYSSHDRSQVASVVQGMRKVRPDMDIFWDLEGLHSGDYWDPAIKQEIDARDVLYLCWSHFARESKHVENEWRYALDRKGLNFIEPIPFEPSELCPPPAELASKHFNDRLLYFTLRQAGD